MKHLGGEIPWTETTSDEQWQARWTSQVRGSPAEGTANEESLRQAQDQCVKKSACG